MRFEFLQAWLMRDRERAKSVSWVKTMQYIIFYSLSSRLSPALKYSLNKNWTYSHNNIQFQRDESNEIT